MMFELMRRFSKFLKLGSQSLCLLLIVMIILSSLKSHLDDLGQVLLIGSCLAMICIEVLSRAFVWIISGYFENNPNTHLETKKVAIMRDYYTMHRVKKWLTALR